MALQKIWNEFLYIKGVKQEEHAKLILELHKTSSSQSMTLARQVEINAIHHKKSIYEQSLSGVKGQARNVTAGIEQELSSN